jgi:hypothetical protein
VWHSALTSLIPFTLPFLCASATIGGSRVWLPITPPQKTIARSAPNSPKAFVDTQHKVETLLDEYRPKLRQFVEQDISLPLWVPPSDLDQNTRSHLERLKLPVLSQGSTFPSLLLHNLENAHHDPGFSDRLSNLFNVNRSRLSFLCNTSGSGKTRTIFQGLCQNWGLYFTARTAPDDIGSTDLEEFLTELQRYTRGRNKSDEEDVDFVSDLAERRAAQLLYARLLIFYEFLQIASKQPSGRKQWLLLQVAPKTLVGSDIFLQIYSAANLAKFDDLRAQCGDLLDKIKLIISCRPFCVLDEAQAALRVLPNWFRGADGLLNRSVLRPIVVSWSRSTATLRMIISGTGVSIRELDEVFTSAVAKEPQPPEMVVNIGSFDNEETQTAYLRLYLPTGLLDTTIGKALASRVVFWLHGRFVWRFNP